MSPLSQRPPRKDAARNAGALVQAAREVFAERGPDAPLDDIARRAGVGNATLYRHFPTRGDLLVAAYAEEVEALCRRGGELDLYQWLEEFVVHVAGKRALAAAITETPDGRRTALYAQWHDSMRSTAAALLARAQAAGEVTAGLDPADLLTLVSGAALAGADPGRAHRLLALLRHGLDPR